MLIRSITRHYVVETDAKTGKLESREQKIPLPSHVLAAVSSSTLALLRGGYEESIVSFGGKLHLMGALFFSLTTLVVYTGELIQCCLPSCCYACLRDMRIVKIRGAKPGCRVLHSKSCCDSEWGNKE